MRYVIPVPPSVNAMWCNRNGGGGKGRYRSKKYCQWIEDASKMLLAQGIEELPFKRLSLAIYIARPSKRCDVDNRIKAIPDLLQKCNVIRDDSLIDKISIEWLGKDDESYIEISGLTS